LQAGAARVFAVDTAYGELAWKLRQDARVTVMERSNALHTEPPVEDGTPVRTGLVVIDLGWTPQRLAVPAAAKWLGGGGRIISLVKPHYEVPGRGRGAVVLPAEEAEGVAHASVAALGTAGFACERMIESPVLGGARKRGSAGKGNREWLAILRPLESA
jgi:23S rRNA (cytidine1920-2'-O)/16S rRNA (cytidine1409-2'-O)-methyltransferase